MSAIGIDSGTAPRPPVDARAEFARWLAARPDEQLAEILELRPDAAVPPPAGSTILAARLLLASSVQRAVAYIDTLGLAVIEVLIGAGANHEAVPRSVIFSRLRGRATKTQITASVDGLLRQALIWTDEASETDPNGLRCPAALREALPWRTLQLTGPLARKTLSDIAARLAECTDEERELLTKLAHGSQIGVSSDAHPQAPADRPVARLLAADLLARVNANTVELPAVVGAVVRGETPRDPQQLRPPTPAGPAIADVEAAAATEALTLLRECGAIIDVLGSEPAAILQGGGIGIRELRRVARSSGVSEPRTALIVELLATVDLIGAGTISAGSSDGGRGADDGDDGVRYAPTIRADPWRQADPAQRWAQLASTWLVFPRRPAVIGQRFPEGGVIAALSSAARSTVVPAERTAVLAAIASAGANIAPEVSELHRALTYRYPRWTRRLTEASLRELLDEGEAVGLVARGALTAAGRAALAGDAAAVADACRAALPEPIDHFLLQGDHTVTAPGPLNPTVAEFVTAIADLESAGVASVYRVTDATVRRALDTGRSAPELHALLAQHSRTPVPQSLTYLVNDVARRYGQLRVGIARSFVRSDDPAILAAVAGHPVAAALELRVIAATVAISSAPLGAVVTALRDAGFAAAGEDLAGGIIDVRPPGARVTGRSDRLAEPEAFAPVPATGVDTARALATRAVAQVRRHDDVLNSHGALAAGREQLPMRDSADVLHTAAAAIEAGEQVQLDYVDHHGLIAHRVVYPRSIHNGRVSAQDARSGLVHEFSLHRITRIVSMGQSLPAQQ